MRINEIITELFDPKLAIDLEWAEGSDYIAARGYVTVTDPDGFGGEYGNEQEVELDREVTDVIDGGTAEDPRKVKENFADGRNPQDKGDSKRHGVPTKASVSTLRKVAKQGGRKGQLAHWMANMKAGKAKNK